MRPVRPDSEMPQTDPASVHAHSQRQQEPGEFLVLGKFPSAGGRKGGCFAHLPTVLVQLRGKAGAGPIYSDFDSNRDRPGELRIRLRNVYLGLRPAG